MPELRPFAALRIAHRQRVRDVLASAWPDRGSQQQFLIAALAHTVDFFYVAVTPPPGIDQRRSDRADRWASSTQFDWCSLRSVEDHF